MQFNSCRCNKFNALMWYLSLYTGLEAADDHLSSPASIPPIKAPAMCRE